MTQRPAAFRAVAAPVSVAGMNTGDAGSLAGERCKHDMIPGYCGLCRAPSVEQGGVLIGHQLPAQGPTVSSRRPTSIPPRVVSRPQGTEYESPSLEAGSSVQAIPAISHRR